MSQGTRRALACLALVGLCVAAYSPGITSPFVQYDDALYVTDNLKVITTPGWAGLAKQWDDDRAWNGYFVEYFPLRDTVYWALFQSFGLNPIPFHLTSLLFHVSATLLMMLLLLRLGLEEKAAFFASVIFAVHPVHIESVVWVAGLKDPLYTTFMLMGLAAYASYRKEQRVGSYVVMLLGLICALLVKSLAIVMPLLMLGMEVLIGERARWRLIITRLAGPSIITALFLASFVLIGKANYVVVDLHGGSRMSHTVLMLWSQAKYLKQALLPTSFRLIYCFEPPTGWMDWRLWVGLSVLLAGVGLAVHWRKDKLKLFFLGWYAVALLPVSNLVPFPAIMADRYLYVASLGTCALLGLLAAQLKPRLFQLVLLATAVMLTVTTAARSWVWQDEEALWEEPDRDPACVTDTAFPAAQSHVMRFRSAKDRREGLMALERALISPGLKNTGAALICSAIIAAAGEAAALGETARAVTWAKLANRQCPYEARGWNIAMVLNIHKNPRVAEMTATKAYRLNKMPQAEALMWLTRLEIADERAPRELIRLAELGDAQTCQKIVQWSVDAPQFAPRFAEAVEACLKRGLANAPVINLFDRVRDLP